MMISNKRLYLIPWFIELAHTAAKRSEDPYKKVGAIAIRPDNTIAAVCYNGAPPKIEIDWSNRDNRRSYVIHAEMNAMRYIKPHECDRVATTLSPCVDCLKNLVAYGIKDVYYSEVYENCDFSLVEKVAELYKIRLHFVKHEHHHPTNSIPATASDIPLADSVICTTSSIRGSL
jgi:dCMP deaminase